MCEVVVVLVIVALPTMIAPIALVVVVALSTVIALMLIVNLVTAVISGVIRMCRISGNAAAGFSTRMASLRSFFSSSASTKCNFFNST